jgi:hypothetical protein
MASQYMSALVKYDMTLMVESGVGLVEDIVGSLASNPHADKFGTERERNQVHRPMASFLKKSPEGPRLGPVS